ncbi:MAG: hypothetical protein GQ574_24780 [Crocinitomix sp.]|nr:hypothetical protein [Crocinitomix sp.]
MKEVYYVYNNEAISSCIFLSILDDVENIDIPRSCLILPFLLDDRTVNYLNNNIDIDFNLEEMISDSPRLFTSFNKRYLSLLPVTINSLILLRKSAQILIGTHISKLDTDVFDSADLGQRFRKIETIIPRFLMLIDPYSTQELYKILKVQL